MLSFASAANAVACGIAMQQATTLKRRPSAKVPSPALLAGEGAGEGPALCFRCGVESVI
jgi:hypothetical protein